jgi:hypothetical protein
VNDRIILMEQPKVLWERELCPEGRRAKHSSLVFLERLGRLLEHLGQELEGLGRVLEHLEGLIPRLRFGLVWEGQWRVGETRIGRWAGRGW